MSDTQINTFQIEDNAVDSAKIEDLSITDDDIAVNADIQQSKILNLESDLDSKLDKSGGTMTGPLFGVAPINALDAATKEFVDESYNIILQATSFRIKKPSVTQLIPGNTIITVSPYKVLLGSDAVSSTNSTNIELDSSNLENNDPIVWGNKYFLYITTSGLIFSSTAPNNLKLHPTNEWLYVCTIFTQTSPDSIVPFSKVDEYYRFTQTQYTILDTNTRGNYSIDLSSFLPPQCELVELIYHGHEPTNQGNFINFFENNNFSGSWWGGTSTAQDLRGCWGYPYSGNRQGSGMSGNTLVLLDSAQFIYIKVDNFFGNNTGTTGRALVRIGGFIESWL